ncbi:LysM peptidoglycan-binding domain-containing protein [Bacillus sp. Marseille-P3661]|uniref:LysM peptidoglycan-binding domain-containing protein n=1 Tax=Bacillus sp. Marseille-P3661 TaxID=1936234 RepID=UPI000C8310AE|nr:LysM peptidoglycan-binding domain-containing protein [Bacillus sp. Marseille-P3661]
MKRFIRVGITAMCFLWGGELAQAESIELPKNQTMIKDNTAYIPVEFLHSKLQAKTEWEPQTKTIRIHKDDTVIQVQSNSSVARVNKQYHTIPSVFIKNNKSYIPLRFITNALHISIESTEHSFILQNLEPYRVKEGDSLWTISRKSGVSVPKIQWLNQMKDDKLQANQILYLYKKIEETDNTEQKVIFEIDQKEETLRSPNDTENNLGIEHDQPSNINVEKKDSINNTTIEPIPYEVKKGDSLWMISTAFKIPLHDLLAYNGLTEESIIRIGERLQIPVRVIPVQSQVSENHGEYLDWWTEAKFLLPIGEIATVTDYETGMSFKIKRTMGVNHADAEPLTLKDTEKAKEVWGGFSWNRRAVTVEVGERKLAASMSFMPHEKQYILDNEFEGHFDLHFKNSTRHLDDQQDPDHQAQIKIAAGVHDY